MFRSLAGAMLIALALTSCSTVKAVTGFTVDQQKISVAVVAAAAAEKAAAKVLRFPICTPAQKVLIDQCVTVELGDTIQRDTKAVNAARDSLWAASKGDPNGVGAYDAYEAFQKATAALKKDVGA